MVATHYDVLVIGSGFGGSVTALRLTEKGYKVGVLEAGARFEDKDFADTSFDAKRFLFMPQAGCYGIQRIDMVKDCLIMAGAGVGGGSLVYANTLYEPLDAFYRDPSWSHITDWKAELAPYYDQAKRMLGVVENPGRTASDDLMEKVADEMGVGDTFHATPVGVFFGGPGQAPGETAPVDTRHPPTASSTMMARFGSASRVGSKSARSAPTRTRATRSWSAAPASRATSASWRPSVFTTIAPSKLSCVMADTSPTRSWTVCAGSSTRRV